jgi:tRNA A37 threonylcarbamoyladenosine biosynthesis protein TsaE
MNNGLARIANQIADDQLDRSHLILIAGPSSAGKTTFSRRLTIQLLALGSHRSRWNSIIISSTATKRPWA